MTPSERNIAMKRLQNQEEALYVQVRERELSSLRTLKMESMRHAVTICGPDTTCEKVIEVAKALNAFFTSDGGVLDGMGEEKSNIVTFPKQ